MPPIRRNKNTAVERVADKFGGFAPFSRLLGLRCPSAVRNWNGRGGGVIPAKYHVKILALAKKKRVRVTIRDLVNI